MKKYLRKLIKITGLLFVGLNASAQGFNEVQKITAFDREIDDQFGKDVAVSGDYAVVGSFSDDFGPSNPNMGSVHVYHRELDGSWVFVQKLSNSDQDDYDRFGWSVAIDGDLIVVGAYREDHNVVDAELLSNAGSAYIFERDDAGVWNQVQKIVAADRTEEDEFGYSVAIHNEVIVIGARHNSTDAAGANFDYHAGAAYIFEREIDGLWTQAAKIVASDREGNPGNVWVDHEDWNWLFGSCVDIYESTVVVASPFAIKGYVFEKVGDAWIQAQTLSYTYMGWLDRSGEIAIHGDIVVIGAQTFDYDDFGSMEYVMNAGGAGIFEKNDEGTWINTRNIVASDRSAGDHFGINVDVFGDYIVVGAHSENEDEFSDDTLENTGGIYIYRKIGTDWIEYGKSDASDRMPEDELGISVAIDNEVIFAGAFNHDLDSDGGPAVSDAGAVYIYHNADDVDCPTVYGFQTVHICDGDFIEIGEHSYDEFGTYHDTFESSEGCDSILVTYLRIDGAEVYSTNWYICGDIPVVIDGVEYYETTSFVDTLVSVLGCDSIAYNYIWNTFPLTDNYIGLSGEDLIALSVEAYGFQWLKCDPYEIIEGEIYNTLVSPPDGNYALIAYSWEGCADTSDCLYLGVIDETGLEDQLEFGEISIFPNPSNGSFNINLEQMVSPVKLEIINELGQVIYSKNLLQKENLVRLSNTAPGLYLIRLEVAEGAVYRKILIE